MPNDVPTEVPQTQNIGSGNTHRRWFRWRRKASVPTERMTSTPEAAERHRTKSEIVELVQALRTHIDKQSDRSQSLLEKLEGLPDALQSLPQANEINVAMAQTIQDHFEQQRDQAKRLTKVVEDMTAACSHRDETIELLQRHLITAQEKDAHFVNGFTDLGQTMNQISDMQAKSAAVLGSIADAFHKAETRVQDMVVCYQRRHVVSAISAWSLVVAVAALTVFVAVSVTRLIPPRQQTDDLHPITYNLTDLGLVGDQIQLEKESVPAPPAMLTVESIKFDPPTEPTKLAEQNTAGS